MDTIMAPPADAGKPPEGPGSRTDDASSVDTARDVDGGRPPLPPIDARGYPPEWDDVVATAEELAAECGGLTDHLEPTIGADGQGSLWGAS